MALGKHVYVPERCTLEDYALKSFCRSIEGANSARGIPCIIDLFEDSVITTNETLQKGWALKTRAKKICYSKDMKAFLDAELKENKRPDLKLVMEKMTAAKDSNGKSRFKVCERLSSMQIERYYAAKHNKKGAEDDDENLCNETDNGEGED